MQLNKLFEFLGCHTLGLCRLFHTLCRNAIAVRLESRRIRDLLARVRVVEIERRDLGVDAVGHSFGLFRFKLLAFAL